MVITEEEGYEHITSEITKEEEEANLEYKARRLKRKMKKAKNWEKYVEQAILMANSYQDDYDWKTMNTLAWDFYMNITDKASLELAIPWIKRSIEIESNYFNNDTYAHLLYKLGRKEEALKVAEKAVILASSINMSASITTHLIEKIKVELKNRK